MPQPSNPSFRWPGAALSAVLAAGLLDQQVVTPLIASLARDLGASVPEVGWAISAYAVAASLAALTVGPLSDETGRRPWLIGASALLAAGAAVVALVPSYPAFLAARLVAGVAGGTISVVAVAWVADAVPYARRGRIMALLLGGAMGAAILGQVAASFVAADRGPGAAYGGLAVFATAAALGLLGVRGIRRRSGAGGVAPREKVRDYLEFVRTPLHRAVAFGAFCMSGSLVGVSAYGSAWLQETRGLTLPEIGILYGAFGATVMAAQPLAGPAADRFGKKRFAVAASVVVVGLTLALPTLSGPMLIAVLLGLGALSVARIAAFAALRSELVESRRRAAFLAFSNTCSQLGIAVAAGLGGVLYARGFFAVCLGMAGFGALAAASIARIPEPGNREPDAT